MGKKPKPQQFGLLPPEYHFSLNPYTEFRFYKCPECETKTGQRKLPLIIVVEPGHFIALNYANRYCPRCNSLIARKDEIEHFLTEAFKEIKPDCIGNNYVIVGNLEKKAYRENLKAPISHEAFIQNAHDFIGYEEIRMTMGGWFLEGTEPPVMEPPPSTEWVKE